MALRVLLADESSTIKKVFQLALQDFAVDVRPVNVGVDVLTVAQNFKPDIIFADVLLQKRSGYEVAAELKQNAALNGIPVVLMWSGFMELDEDKFQASHANAQLEKPFDVGALRKLVTELVPRTQSQRLSQFLTFPKMPDIEETPAAPQAQAAPSTPPPAPGEDFQQVSIPKMKGGDKYRLNLKPEELEPDNVPVQFDAEAAAIDVEAILSDADEDGLEEAFTVREPNKPTAARPGMPPPPKAAARAAIPQAPELEMDPDDVSSVEIAPLHNVRDGKPAVPSQAAKSTATTRPAPVDLVEEPIATAGLPALTEAQLEKLIREQSAEVIESVVWKVVPDLAAQIIERELNRLLKERESQP